MLTSTRAYRLSPDRGAADRELDLGYGSTTTRDAFVFWSQGKVIAAPKDGGSSRVLTSLGTRPQLFASSGERIAWLGRNDEGRFAVHALVDGKAFKLYDAPGTIDAIAMGDDWVYFVERPNESWRIGGVRATKDAPTRFTGPRTGRSPAMLVARGDLHYYDGNRREVRRLSSDLAREATLARDFVCSPLAVALHVYCANVEGLFELAEGAGPRRLVPGSSGSPVTDLAASSRYLVWLSDAGTDKLEARMLPLDARATAP